MLEKLRIMFTIPELRKKIFLTLGLLAIYRIGFHIPLPMVDNARLTRQEAERPTFSRKSVCSRRVICDN